MTTIKNCYKITLHRGERVLKIGDDGSLRMVEDYGNNGTLLKMVIEIDKEDMRQNISLYLNDEIITFNESVKADDVYVKAGGIPVFVVEKDKFSQNVIALTNDRFGDLALDDYQGDAEIEGPIKWWNVWKDGETGQNTIKPNQWFNVHRH